MITASIQKTAGILMAAFICSLIFIPSGLFAGEPPVAAACDIQHGACSTDLDDGTKLAFDILPKPVKAMTELTFVVQLKKKGQPVSDAGVSIDLSMPGMYMGKNSPVLQHVAGGRYEGKGLVTRCMSGRKTWQADITIARGKQARSANFIFEVH